MTGPGAREIARAVVELVHAPWPDPAHGGPDVASWRERVGLGDDTATWDEVAHGEELAGGGESRLVAQVVASRGKVRAVGLTLACPDDGALQRVYGDLVLRLVTDIGLPVTGGQPDRSTWFGDGRVDVEVYAHAHGDDPDAAPLLQVAVQPVAR